MRSASPDLAGSLVAAAAAYAGALLLAPWLSAPALLLAAAVTLGALALPWQRRGRPAAVPVAAGLWAPLHLSLLATGGWESPLLPALSVWILLIGAWGAFPQAAQAGAAAFVLLVAGEVAAGSPTVRGGVEAAAAIAGGLGPAWFLDRFRRRSEAELQALDRIRAELESGAEGDEEVEVGRRLAELDRALDQVRRSFGARRATLWRIDAELDRARPWVVSGGDLPPVVRLTGDPLRWAWEEGLPLGLDTPPHWAAGAERLSVVPLDPRGEDAGLLTLETGRGADAPTPEGLEEAALYLLAFVRMYREKTHAIAVRELSKKVLEVLRGLPKEIELTAFARALAESARDLAAGTGAVVASWEHETGRVLAVVGEDGGPEIDAAFGPMQSELALAARGGARIVRADRHTDRHAIPVAAPGERWVVEPRSVIVLPLAEPGGTASGVVAVWSTQQSSLGPNALTALETLAPYAALQLRHARAYGNLRIQAERDALTGLHNRRAFEDRIAAECSHFDRYRRPAALILLDIDRFKSINDTYGHETGDAVLRAIGQAVRASVRESDFAARFGGEEFVVLLPETGLAEAREAADRLRRRIAEMSLEGGGRRFTVTASLGVSACPECVDDPRGLVGSADAALYTSKAAGRNRVTVARLA